MYPKYIPNIIYIYIYIFYMLHYDKLENKTFYCIFYNIYLI